jgi:putative heme iron utilization protein
MATLRPTEMLSPLGFRFARGVARLIRRVSPNGGFMKAQAEQMFAEDEKA